MVYAQFYQLSVPHAGNNFTPEAIEACGDRGVIILDGRANMMSHFVVARAEAVKRGYIGFQIRKGDSFSRYRVASAIVPVGAENCSACQRARGEV